MIQIVEKSIQRKFLAIMLITLISVNGPLLGTFFIVSTNTIEQERVAKKHAILDVNSKALSKPLWDFDYDNLSKWAKTIALDQDIAIVEILDDNNKSLAVVRNKSQTGQELAENENLYSKGILHIVDGKTHTVGTLKITFFADHIENAAWKEVGKSALLFIVSTISVLFAAIMANRLMIATPLKRLSRAIESTRRTGTRKQVDWESSDELGKVVGAFNEMQVRLDQDEAELVNANRRLAFLYNNTPVMLYSVDEEDRIQKVSDYWLHATGYREEDVLGHKFSEFINEDIREEYAKRPSLRSIKPKETRERTSLFRNNDGTLIPVLLREAIDFDDKASGRRTLSVMTDISKLKAAEAEILKQAQTDVVTGLLNRAGFTEYLEAAIGNADDQTGIAVLFFDLDRFKWVNDNLGHFAGDRVLREVASSVGALLSPTDWFGRFGGDEFAIMLTGQDVKAQSMALADRINALLSQPIALDDRTVQISASVGISYFPDNGTTAEELLKASDVAMYKRKKNGRNGYCVFDEKLGKEAARQFEVNEMIVEGLEHDWFTLHYQPIVDLQSGNTLGFEGLLRLDHPKAGLIPPLEIIRASEQTGQILKIGDLVLDLGVEALERLQACEHLKSAYVSINLSAAQFLPTLPTRLAARLMNRAVLPGRLALEITETVLMQRNLDLDDVFQEIKTLGCKFLLDDFGTGFSSLSYMNRFPVDAVKIDRSFIMELNRNPKTQREHKALALIEGVVGLSHNLNLKVIAEGIETEDQFQLLRDMGVDAGQGFLLGKVEPLDNHLNASNEGQEQEPKRAGAR